MGVGLVTAAAMAAGASAASAAPSTLPFPNNPQACQGETIALENALSGSGGPSGSSHASTGPGYYYATGQLFAPTVPDALDLARQGLCPY
jgi:hypothetical protein